MVRQVNELAMPTLNSSKCGDFAKQKTPFGDSLNDPQNDPRTPYLVQLKKISYWLFREKG